MITFTLIRSDLPDGRVAIVLYLYRDKKTASVSTIATVAPNQARSLFNESRAHLRKLGVRDANEIRLERPIESARLSQAFASAVA